MTTQSTPTITDSLKGFQTALWYENRDMNTSANASFHGPGSGPRRPCSPMKRVPGQGHKITGAGRGARRATPPHRPYLPAMGNRIGIGRGGVPPRLEKLDLGWIGRHHRIELQPTV